MNWQMTLEIMDSAKTYIDHKDSTFGGDVNIALVNSGLYSAIKTQYPKAQRATVTVIAREAIATVQELLD